MLFLFAVNLAVIAALYFFNVALIGLCSGCAREAIEAALVCAVHTAAPGPCWISVGALLYSFVHAPQISNSQPMLPLTVAVALSALLGIAVFFVVNFWSRRRL